MKHVNTESEFGFRNLTLNATGLAGNSPLRTGLLASNDILKEMQTFCKFENCAAMQISMCLEASPK